MIVCNLPSNTPNVEHGHKDEGPLSLYNLPVSETSILHKESWLSRYANCLADLHATFRAKQQAAALRLHVQQKQLKHLSRENGRLQDDGTNDSNRSLLDGCWRMITLWRTIPTASAHTVPNSQGSSAFAC